MEVLFYSTFRVIQTWLFFFHVIFKSWPNFSHFYIFFPFLVLIHFRRLLTRSSPSTKEGIRKQHSSALVPKLPFLNCPSTISISVTSEFVEETRFWFYSRLNLEIFFGGVRGEKQGLVNFQSSAPGHLSNWDYFYGELRVGAPMYPHMPSTRVHQTLHLDQKCVFCCCCYFYFFTFVPYFP